MKILVARTSDGTLGGAEQATRDYARAFARSGHSVCLVTNVPKLLPNEPKIYIRTRKSPVPASPITPLIKIFMPLAWLYYGFLALREKPDLINTQGREEHVGFTLTKWLHNRPVIWADPGDLIHQLKIGRKGILGNINQRILIRAIHRCDGIYTLNEDSRKSILKTLSALYRPLDPSKLTVIESNVLFSDYKTDAVSPRNTDRTVISFIGRLHKSKGVDLLLNSFLELAKSNKDIELWIVGEGPTESELKTLAMSNDRVILWGFQTDISSFLARTDIFVQPAHYEGWGRNVKEAMYFGKPVIGSDVGGIAVQIEDGKTGALFEPGNTKQLTRKLEQLIKDKGLRRRLGESARKKALKDGDYINLIQNKILPLFERILKQHEYRP